METEKELSDSDIHKQIQIEAEAARIAQERIKYLGYQLALRLNREAYEAPSEDD